MNANQFDIGSMLGEMLGWNDKDASKQYIGDLLIKQADQLNAYKTALEVIQEKDNILYGDIPNNAIASQIQECISTLEDNIFECYQALTKDGEMGKP